MPKRKSKRKAVKRPQRQQKVRHSAPVIPPPTETRLETTAAVGPSFSAPFISDRMNGFFQVAAVVPFFVTAWVSNGVIIGDIFLFSVFFGSIVLGTMTSSVMQRQKEIPFPEQLQQIFLVLAVVMAAVCYSETKSAEVSLILAAATFLRILSAKIEPRSLLSFFLVLLSLVVSSSLIAPLGAYLHERHVYYPFLLFGYVPSMILGSALVIKYSPLFESRGWARTRMRVNRQGKEVKLPAGISRLFILLLLGGPLLPALLVPFHYLANSFVLPVLSLARAPNIAEDFLHQKKPEAELFFKVTLLAILSELLLLGAAFL